MLCDYVKNENELYGYSCLAMDYFIKNDIEVVNAYLKAFESAKDHILLLDQNQIVELYKNSVRLFTHNKFDEFANYFTRNFSVVLNKIGEHLSNQEILKQSEIMMVFANKYKQSELQNIDWSISNGNV